MMSVSIVSELTPEEKKLMEAIKKELELAIKTGKIKYGYRNTLRALHKGDAKIVIIARNIPKDMKAVIAYLSALGNVPIVFFPGNAKELGEACKRPHIISSLVILDPGTSQIMKYGKILQL